MPGQIPPASIPPTPETAPPAASTTPPANQAPSASGQVAAAVDADEVKLYTITDPREAGKIVKKANKQAARYRDERNRIAQDLAAERSARASLEQTHAAKLAEAKAAQEKVSLDFKTSVLDNTISASLRGAGATDAQVARLLASARAEAMAKGVKVNDQFKVEGDLDAVVKTLSADFGFSGAKPADKDKKAPPGAEQKLEGEKPAGSQTIVAMLGNKRNVNGALHTPGDAQANLDARSQRLAAKIEADWKRTEKG